MIRNKGIVTFRQIRQIGAIPKRELLFLDTIEIPDFERELKTNFDARLLPLNVIADLEYLAQDNIIKEIPFKSQLDLDFYLQLQKSLEIEKKNIPNWLSDELTEYIKLITYESWEPEVDGHSFLSKNLQRLNHNAEFYRINYLMRYLSQNKLDGYLPISISRDFSFQNESKLSKQDVLHTMINKMLLPKDETPLEQIIDFKNDKEATNRLNALRLWIHDMANKNEDLQITQTRLQVLLEDYNKYISVQKLKFNMGFFEMAITTSAEIIENLLKLKLSNMAKSLFKLKYNKITLIENELKAPGREVAYIHMVNDKFR